MTGALFAVTSRAANSFEMIAISRVLVGINAGMSFVSVNICVGLQTPVIPSDFPLICSIFMIHVAD